MSDINQAFWEIKQLEEMTAYEWELLCDGCGKCCLNKIEDEETGVIYHTSVACKLFDSKTCQCQNYPNRRKIVSDCQQLTPKKVRSLPWLPSTCAYRLIADGKKLPPWHHLISGSRSTIHKQGESVRGRVISEGTIKVEALEDYVIDWIT